MSFEQQTVESITSRAGTEPNISVEHPFTHVITIYCSAGSKVDSTLDTLLASHLVGTGRVDLVKIHASAQCTTAGSSVMIGFCEVGANIALSSLAMRENGFKLVANAMNVGAVVQADLIPEDRLSYQIRPVSSMLPTMKIKAAVSEDASLNLVLYIKVHGPIYVFTSLN